VAYSILISTRETEALAHIQAQVPDNFFAIKGIGEVKEELPPPPVAFSLPKDPWSYRVMRRSCEEESFPLLATETLRPSPKHLR
jgi:hypothetical protein